MKESDIFLYVAVSVAEKAQLILDRSDYITDRFVRSAERVIAQTDEKLDQIQGSKSDLEQQVIDYITHYDQKLENERSLEWIRFCQNIKEIVNG